MCVCLHACMSILIISLFYNQFPTMTTLGTSDIKNHIPDTRRNEHYFTSECFFAPSPAIRLQAQHPRYAVALNRFRISWTNPPRNHSETLETNIAYLQFYFGQKSCTLPCNESNLNPIGISIQYYLPPRTTAVLYGDVICVIKIYRRHY